MIKRIIFTLSVLTLLYAIISASYVAGRIMPLDTGHKSQIAYDTIGETVLTLTAQPSYIISESSITIYAQGAAPSPPAPPASAQASQGSFPDVVQIAWSGSTGASGYKVYRKQSSIFGEDGYLASSASSPFNDNSAIAGITYNYWVKAYNSGGESDPASAGTGYRSAPAAPTNVSASDGTSISYIEISWSSSIGADGYYVYRNTVDSSSNATQLNTSLVSSPYQDNDQSVIPGNTYYYFVKAHNGAGNSGFSSSNGGWMKLSPPTGVAATKGIYTDKVQVTWAGSRGASKYKVYRSTQDDSSTAGNPIGPDQQSPFNDGWAWPNTHKYYYWVKASCSRGGIDYDSDFSFPSDIGWRKLNAPTNVQATSDLDDKIRITWTGVDNAIGYKIYRNTTDQIPSNELCTATSPYDDTGTTSAYPYYYWVKAYNNDDDNVSSYTRGLKQTHRAWGVCIKDSTTISGVDSSHSFYKYYNVPSIDAVLYAPAVTAANKCPLEVVSRYYYDINTSSYKKQIALWNHYSGINNFVTTIDGNDVDKYLDEAGYYYTEILYWGAQTGWQAYLWDFSQGVNAWVYFGNTEIHDRTVNAQSGWDFFEEYNFHEDSWPALGSNKIFTTYNLKIQDNGNWYYVNDYYGDNTIYAYSFPYYRHYLNDYYSWYVEDQP